MPRVITPRRPYRLLAGILMTALIAGFTGAVGVRTAHAASGWVNQNVTAPNPVVSVYDSIHHTVLAFDGTNTWTWNTPAKTWTAIPTVNSPAAGGVNFAMAFDSARGKAVIVASPTVIGQPATNFTTTWEFDGTDWTQLAPAHNPPARYGFSQALVYDSQRAVTVLVSGQFNDSPVPADTWEWNGTDWTDRTTATGPVKRYNHCLAYDSTRHVTVLFGGQENHGSGDSTFTDTWEYNGVSWLNVPSSGGPQGFNCYLTYDPLLGRTIGLAAINAPLNAIVLEPSYWDGTSWVDTQLAGPGADGFAAAYDIANDAVVVNLSPLSVGSDETWLLNPPPPPPPGGGSGPPPLVTAISPDHGQSGVVTTVTITGTGFAGATAMSFHAGQPVMNLCGQQPVAVVECFTVNSDTQITALSPPLDISSADVYVVTPNGISAYSPADVYTYEGWDQSTPANNSTIDVPKNPAYPTTFTLRLLESGMATIGHSPLPTWMTCTDTRNPPTTAGITAQVDCSVSPTNTETDTISFYDAKDASRVPTRTVTIRVIYQPNPDGYNFPNINDKNPSYSSMVADYPASAGEMTWPIVGGETIRGALFFQLFKSFMDPGLCYGFAATSTYFYNDYNTGPLKVYTAFPTIGSPLPVAFDGQNGVPVQALIERYHSRQLAQLGALDSSVRYTQAVAAGNLGVYNQLVTQVAIQPETVAIVPNKTINPFRWNDLFNHSHMVVAYDKTTNAKGQRQLKVYNPNSPNIPSAVLTFDDQGGLTLSDDVNGISYGGGGKINGGGDFGKPSEWLAVPIPDFTWQDGSTASIGPIQIDNQHWVLDSSPTPIVFMIGAAGNAIPSKPILMAAGTGPSVQVNQVPAGSTFTATLLASNAPATVGQFSANHVALATQTDAAAPGSTHNLSIDAAASSLHLSAASGSQQYTLRLGADYLPSYGRQLTVSGVTLAPGAAIDMSTDAASSSYKLSSTGADQILAAVIERTGQGAGSATVQALIPGAGGQATLNVSDWNDLAHSLIYETIVSNGKVTVRILQDNPGQRQSLADSLFQQLSAVVATIPDSDLRKALDAAVQVSLALFHGGDHKTAAALLLGLERATALLAAKHAITAATGASIISLSQQIRGLL